VAHLLRVSHGVYVGGPLEGVALPKHYDYVAMRRTPAQVLARCCRAVDSVTITPTPPPPFP